MQIKKDDIRMKILNAAKLEFFSKGYKDASMRTIADAAGVSTSNIYNYFKDKDELLDETLLPVINYFNRLLKEHNEPKNLNINFVFSEDRKDKVIKDYTRLILDYKEELRLLLFNSYGSKYTNFREEYTEKNLITGKEYIRLLNKNNPDLKNEFSELFMHTVCNWHLSIIGELVYHQTTRKEIIETLNECFTFSIAGWSKLILG